jgi:decaprenylphospho-beta-D-ribofuranose 2-oxidase
MTRELLSGWGRTPRSTAEVHHPDSIESLLEAFDKPGPRGIIARGLGRSYGDPAQNAGGDVIDVTGVSGITALDVETGLVTALAGTSLHDLMRWLVPLGWFVPVTPGTRYVTVGGAIGNDIHGKNHHGAGSWCNHVTSITLATPAHGVVTVGPDDDPDLFWATAGGVGLTGVILDATFRLERIETSHIMVDTDRTENLDDVMALMSEGDDEYEFSVAWIDLLSTGRNLGRSVLERGRLARLDELGARARRDPLAYHAAVLLPIPIEAPSLLINPLTVGVFNELWYRKSAARGRAHLLNIPRYFHPLDMIKDWNRGYGPSGLLQWQIVVPFGAEDTMRRVVEEIAHAGFASFVNVLKRFGPGNSGLLSFPSPGWTLSVDLAADAAGASAVLDRLDEAVIEAGGRHYLAKDSRMRPETLAAGYPRLDEWRTIRSKVDPDHVLQSDLGRRLGLV